MALRSVNFPGLIPDPNIAGTRGANGNPVQNYFDGRTRSSNYDLFSVRADHPFSSKDTLMARYSLTDSNAFAPNTFPGYGSLDNARQMAGTLAYTRILRATVDSPSPALRDSGVRRTSPSEDSPRSAMATDRTVRGTTRFNSWITSRSIAAATS